MKSRLVIGLCVASLGCTAAPGGGGGGLGSVDGGGDGSAVSGADSSAPSDGSGSKGDSQVGSDATPGGAGTVGSPCEKDSDCGGFAGLTCFKKIDPQPAVGFPGMTWPGGYCSKSCGDADSDCGPGGSCVQAGSSGGRTSVSMQYCTKACKKSDECRVVEGYSCQIVILSFGMCVPP